MQLLINVVCGIFFYVFYDILHADIHIYACSRRFFDDFFRLFIFIL